MTGMLIPSEPLKRQTNNQQPSVPSNTRHHPPFIMVTQETQKKLEAFVAERDWKQFHTPENLAKSISIEAAELLECFQWGPNAEPKRVKEELADVLTYCLHLARAMDLDPEKIVLEKLEITRKKYPVDKCRGSSKKYNEL